MNNVQASSLALAVVLVGTPVFGQTNPAAPTTASPSPPAPGPEPSSAAVTGQPTADTTVDQARDAFTLGTTLAAQGEWTEALRAFERSSKLHPHPVTTYNVAYTERALGHYTRAYKLFLQSLSEHESAKTGQLPDDLLALAKSYAGETEHRLAHVFVRVARPGAALSVDGRPLEVASSANAARPVLMAGTRDDRGNEAPPAGSFELLIDPGRHLFVSSQPGAPDEVRSETFDSGASRELVLGSEPEPASKQGRAATPVSADLPSTGSSKRTWAYVSYGVGAAGLVTGSIFGVLAIGKKSYLDSDGRCPNKVCQPGFQGDLDTANLHATIATVGFIVAGVGGGLGTYLFLTSKPDKEGAERHAKATVEPWLGPAMLGARGRF